MLDVVCFLLEVAYVKDLLNLSDRANHGRIRDKEYERGTTLQGRGNTVKNYLLLKYPFFFYLRENKRRSRQMFLQEKETV
jgi:hypothetical protein